MPDKDTHLPTHYTIDQAEDEVGVIRGDLDLLGEAHSQVSATDIPDNPASGHIMFATAGHMRYASGVDGDSNYYATGRNSNGATAPLNLTTSLQTMPGLSVGLGVGTYRINAQLLLNGVAAGGTPAYQLNASGGLTVSNGRYSVLEFSASSATTLADYTTVGTTLTSTAGMGANNRVVLIHAFLIISVAGTLNVQVKQNATANGNVVQYGCYLESMPVL